MGQGSDSIRSSGDFEEFSSLASAQSNFSGTTRRIVCGSDGTLVVKQAEGGTQRTITIKAWVAEEICVTGFVAAGSSGCVPIRVYR
jgi:hypothetical protein